MLLFRVDALNWLSGLSWPLMLLYMIACVLLIRRNDLCPWCGKSFSSSERPEASATGFDALFRKQCANCGQPDSAN